MIATSLVTVAGALGAIAGTASASAVSPPVPLPLSLTSAPSTYPPPDLINPASLEASATNSYGQYYPGGVYSATAAQITSLENMENEAVNDVIDLHGLGPGDAPQVETWGRNGADAVLWSLMYEAMSASNPTTDQQNVVAWLQAVAQRNAIMEADDSGLEYTKWAGLGAGNYDQLLASNPSEGALQSFFSQAPVNYTSGEDVDTPYSPSNEGYCLYQAPSPYQSAWGDVYSGGGPEDCYEPETVPAEPAPPTLTDWMDWGQADVTGQLTNTAGFTAAAEAVAEEYTQYAVAGASGIGTVLAAACGGCINVAIADSSPLGQQLFPFSAAEVTPEQLARQNIMNGANAEAAEAGEEGVEATDEALDTVEQISEVADGVLDALAIATPLAGPVFTLLEAVVALVQGTIEINEQATLPGQLAALISGASTEPDMSSIASNPGSLSGLYALFIGSTLPAPALGEQCDDSSLIDVQSDATTSYGSQVVPCMNAPTPLADLPSNPQWVVTPEGSTTSTTEPTITWENATTNLTSTTYLAGNWFADTATLPGQSAATVQELQLDYTDWKGNDQIAWLLDSSTDPQFVVTPAASLGAGFDPGSCLSAGACTLTKSIDLVSPSGQDFSVSVSPGSEPPAPPSAPSSDPTEMALSADPSGSLDIGSSQVTVTATVGSYAVRLSGSVLLFVGPPPAGTVSFFDGGSLIPGCQGMSLAISYPDGSDPEGTASCQFSLTSGGPHDIVANYSGAGAPGIDTSTAPNSASVTLTGVVRTAVQVTSSPSVPLVGQPVTYTAQVLELAPGVPPTGTVTFTGGVTPGAPMCTDVPLQALDASTASTFNQDGTTSAAAYSASCTYVYTAASSTFFGVEATYNGDTYTLPISSGTDTSVSPSPTTTILQSSPATPVAGQPVSLIATVTAPGSVPPSGTVNFSDAAGMLCPGVAVTGGPSTPTSSVASASCTVTFSQTGSDTVTASFAGNSSGPTSPSAFTPSSTSVTLNGLATSTTSLSASTLTPVVTQDYSLTATVTSLGGSAPTGTVDFTATLPNVALFGGTSTIPVCTGVAISTTAPYVASCDFAGLEGSLGPLTPYVAGTTLTATATYSGDGSTAPSSNSLTITVVPEGTVTTISSSDATPAIGEAVTYTAHVAPAPPATEVGLLLGSVVNFTSGGTTICSDVLPDANGDASCTQTYSSLGPETVTANYDGGGNTLPSSATTTIVVSPTVPVAPASLSADDTGPGQVSFSWPAPSDGGSPVLYYLVYEGTSSGQENQAICGAAAPSTTCTATGLASGAQLYFTVVAVNAVGPSAASPETSATPEASTTTALSSSQDPSLYGQSVTFTAAVSPSDGGGSVAFYVDGSTTPVTGCGAVNLSLVSATYQATCTTSSLAPGTNSISATYSGDSTYLTSTGTLPGGQQVDRAPAFVSATPPLTVLAGQSYTYGFAASGFPAPSYSLGAGAPPWLSISPATGMLSGTVPTNISSFSYSVLATNGVGSPASAGPFTVDVTPVVTLSFTGSLTYTDTGPVTSGSLDVQPTAGAISSVNGTIKIPGASGGTATISVHIARVLGYYIGDVSVSDPGADLDTTALVLTTTLTRTATGQVTGTALGYSGLRQYKLQFTV